MEIHSKRFVERAKGLKDVVAIANFQNDIMMELAIDWIKYRTKADCVTNGRQDMASKLPICIVGAGAAGLSAVYQLMKLPDIPDIICYEKQDTWGGISNLSWRVGVDEYGEPAHNTTYKHLWTNGPKEVFEYPDYSFEDHLTRKNKISYCYCETTRRRFGRIPDLKEKIRFHTAVRLVEYDEDNDVFHVTTADLKTGAVEHKDFSHVIVASGVFYYPNTPEIPGIETFAGRIMHSHDFKKPEELRGQTVLIIGAGWSAEDIAVLGVKFGAKMIYLSYRSVPIGKKWPIGKG
ncbi:SNO1-like protein [Mya arenaria]|uniref:Flavin-containing monooxygenase n=1 Tax=Mya arenaria TaxID=6604 RepID=A0ABY7F8K3_MYAAR|nr:SNO1-like protein [Mya arenaria]